MFDDQRPIDLGSLTGDSVFTGAVVDVLPAATVLRVKLPQARVLQLEQQADGWVVIAKDGPPASPIVMPSAGASRLLFAASAPGRVVVIPDADTGRNLLVGTMRAAGPGVPVPVRLPEFAVNPSWQGVVIEPVSDRVALRAVPEGFVVTTGGALAPTLERPAAFANAAVLTRRFDFPAEPVTTLLRRLQAQVQEEGRAPAQARFSARKAAAQTMLALGLGPEAQSLLRLAVTEDPRASGDPELNGLAGIAALLSYRPEDAGGLDAPGLGGSDEVALWRALRIAMASDASPHAAQALATTAGLVLAYPSAMRDRLLPVVVEALIAGGAGKSADAMLASLPEEPLLAFARAARSEQKGETDAALKLYGALAGGHDRLLSARAAVRATYLRLAGGLISPSSAVQALEQSFAAWRGDGRERDLRLRTAEIAAQANEWRKGLSILREAAQLFPDDAADIARRMTAMVGDLLHGPGAASIKPLDLVALAEENAGIIAKADASGMGLLLADKLTALDLPQRAGSVIEQMIAALPNGVGRAALGARLADLRLSEQDPAAARAALTLTDAPDLPSDVQDDRLMALARARAMEHDRAGATAILARLGTPDADEMRAGVLADDGDWHGAALALDSAAMAKLPNDGPLSPEQQDFVLRLVSAHSQAGEEAALQTLSIRQASRMTGARADMFRLLTSAPVNHVSELRRVGGEVAMARALPSSLAAIGTR